MMSCSYVELVVINSDNGSISLVNMIRIVVLLPLEDRLSEGDTRNCCEFRAGKLRKRMKTHFVDDDYGYGLIQKY